MNYIEREFENNDYDYIDIIYGNNFIKTIELGKVDIDGLYTYTDYNFQVEENILNLTIDVTESSVLIVIEDESDENYINASFDLSDFDFSLHYTETGETDLKIPFYMPTVSYTNLASSIVYDTAEYPDTVPFFDVDSVERFEVYKEDDIITFKHFLDLEFSDHVINQPAIDAAKEQRKEARKLKVKQTDIPKKIFALLDHSEILTHYNSLSDKTNVIPVLNWARGENLIDDIKALNDFDCVAIRINSSYGKFLAYAEDEIKKVFPDNLEDFYIIFDMSNNFAVEQFEDGIITAASIFQKVIYLGSPFSALDLSKARNTETNMNHISHNTPLEIFNYLQDKAMQKDAPLGYGDYCGFDRKSISRSTGGRPSARIVLCSVDKTKKILIRREWDGRDLKTDDDGNESIGLIHSMDQLVLNLHVGALDRDPCGSRFLDEVNYDTDEALKDFYPARPSPATLKTICLRHNYLSIVKNFMPVQSS